MKIAFCTCVQIGLSCIESVYEIGGRFDLFISLHDHKAKKKSGRIYLDQVANEKKVPLLKVNHINDEEVISALKQHDIDWLFIIGWSQIASKQVIETPKMGAIGAHPTLLPKGRGRAAVPWAILKGLDKTGVSFFKMDEGVDTGEILGQYEIPLSSSETATDLYDKVNEAHTHLIQQIWPDLVSGNLVGQVQNESQATYWEGRKPEDGLIKPEEMSLMEVDRLVRATTRPYPGAYIELSSGQKKVIWRGSLEEVEGAEELSLVDGKYYILDYSIE
jgi:methionyl-tRNA formyltransferase